MNDSELRDFAIRAALRAGCDAADVLSFRSENVSVSVRDGVLEDSERAEQSGIGVRVFKGQSAAYAASADMSEQGIKTLLDHLVPMASYVPPDEWARLARADELAKTIPQVALSDTEPQPEIGLMIDVARETESLGLAEKGITKSDGAGVSADHTTIGLSTSNGFVGDYASTGFSLSLGLIGGTGDGMERDYASSAAVRYADLESPRAIAMRSAERTRSRLNPRLGKSGAYPVVFDKRVSASLLRSLVRAVSGNRLAKKTSFLNDALGTLVFHPSVSIIEDPLKPYGLRSRPFDGEGLPVSRRTIVQNGVLHSAFLDLRSADKLGMAPTASASRGLSSPPSPSASNIWVAAGTQNVGDMLTSIKEGFLVTELLGAQISLATGDYSRGASGFWVENGVIAYPVSEMTIAGNLKDMFTHLIPADDLEFRYGVDAPTLFIEGMMVATRD